jgi:hypothetical protein
MHIDKILKYMALLLGVPFSKFLEHHLAHTFITLHHAMFEVEGGLFHVLIISEREGSYANLLA